MHPKFRAIYSAGNHIDRDSYLKYWATGFDPSVIIYWDMRDQRIDVHGDTALVGATNWTWTKKWAVGFAQIR